MSLLKAVLMPLYYSWITPHRLPLLDSFKSEAEIFLDGSSPAPTVRLLESEAENHLNVSRLVIPAARSDPIFRVRIRRPDDGCMHLLHWIVGEDRSRIRSCKRRILSDLRPPSYEIKAVIKMNDLGEPPIATSNISCAVREEDTSV